MRRKPSKLLLISAGAALAWFLDPVSGASRRRQVSERLSGLTGSSAPANDPTGGAVPPATPFVPPTSSAPSPAPAGGSDDPAVLQAVEGGSDGEKVLRGPAPADGETDKDRATLRTTW